MLKRIIPKGTKILKSLVIGLLSFGIVLILSCTSFLKQLELRSSDLKFNLRGFLKADPRIFLIGIDDPSIQTLGRWPWPRTYHAALLEGFKNNPPMALGFDILFTQSDESMPQADESLAQVSRAFDAITFAGFFENKKQSFSLSSWTETVLEKNKILNLENKGSEIREMQGVQLPIKEISEASHVGFINAPKDMDGSLRQLPLIFHFHKKLYPSLSLRLIMDYYGLSGSDLEWIKNSGIRLRLKNQVLDIPTDSQGNFTINFRSNLENFKSGSFAQVLRDKKVQGDIVVVGLTGTGVTDIDPTPLSPNTPLVLVHLNAIQNILQRDFLRIFPISFSILILLLFSLLTAWVSYLSQRWKAALYTSFIFIGYGCLNGFLFSWKNFQFPMVAPSLGIILSYVLATTARFLLEEKEKRFVKKAFQHFVSPSIMKKVLDDPRALALGGKRNELTVLFSDIRMFSSYCERKTPEEVISILNEYFEVMTGIILKHGGTLDKYLGDGLMAIFGAPVDLEKDHALCAVMAAIEMQEKLKELKRIWEKEGKEPLQMGIGINTGSMVVGNMGSSHVMNYTVVGDEVNLASRLEGLTRQFNVDIVISQSTYDRVKECIKGRLLGEVKVKGKEKPVTVYEVIV